jgi:hypothetical protein
VARRAYRADLSHAFERPCKGCGQMVFWLKSKKGRWIPYNPTGVYHGLTCLASKKRLERMEKELQPPC